MVRERKEVAAQRNFQSLGSEPFVFVSELTELHSYVDILIACEVFSKLLRSLQLKFGLSTIHAMRPHIVIKQKEL